jgi:hypothetical protein
LPHCCAQTKSRLLRSGDHPRFREMSGVGRTDPDPSTG